MPPQWIYDATFYHIYPLGLCDAPRRNDFHAAPVPRIEALTRWADHIQALNLNALYLGPVFESTAHGYDTADYYHADRRLGSDDTLKAVLRGIRSRGLRVVLDGVFNHVGRDFWAFRDVQQRGASSPYADWFYHLDFSKRSPYGDAFSYEGWSGHYDLVKLNLANPAVREHLFGAVTQWLNDYDIDGLRLDAADSLDFDFLRALSAHCRTLRSDFWLMGEVVHGDYRRWANPQMLDATTNYECYKGLYSSLVDRNYFEIAYSLNRLFGPEGLYRGLMLYSFADNHDVNRVASMLKNPAHLYPLYILLATMPGVPSIYYGSEWGITGARTPTSDAALRPALALDSAADRAPQPDLAKTIAHVMRLRRDLPALRCGDYRQIHIAHEQFAFARQTPDQTVIVALNAADHPATVPLPAGHTFRDVLNGGAIVQGRTLTLHPYWGAILVLS